MTLKTVYVSAGFFAGLFICFFADDLLLWLLAFAVIVGLFAFAFGSNFRKKIWIVLISFALAVSAYKCYTHFRVTPLERLDGQSIVFRGKVIACTDSDRSTVKLEGEINGISCKTVMFVNNFTGDICDSISMTASVKALGDDGFFDERETYYPDGIYIKLVPEGDIVCSKPEGYTVVDRLRLYSRTCSEKIREYVSGDEGAIITAMSTGDDSHMSHSLRRILNKTGIGHVTSVSGLHVSVTSALILMLFRKVGLKHSVCSLSAMLPVAAYVIFSGIDVCAVRSALMMAVYIFSTVSKRKAYPLNTLALCTFIMCAINPYVAADMSFVLSVSGVFAVSVIYPWAVKALQIRSKIGKALILSTTAWLGTLPALMMYFGEVSLIAPLMNLTLPLFSVALVLTLIFVIVGCTPMLSFLPKLAGLAVKPVLYLAKAAAKMKLSSIPVLSEEIVVTAIVLTVVLLLFCTVIKKDKVKLMAAVATVSVFLITYCTVYAAYQSKLYMNVIYSGKDSMCVLHKSNECIIIDINSGNNVLTTAEDYIIYKGVDEILAATVNKNGESVYSDYSRLSIKPNAIYMDDNAYIYQPDIPVMPLGEQTAVEFADCTITITENGVLMSCNGQTYSVAYGLAQPADIRISLLDGRTVINGTALNDEGIIVFELS